MSADTPRRLPLHDRHLALGARMVPFAGYEMPIRYAAIVDEHHAVRQSAGLFDVSHMGQVWVRGADAVTWLDSMVTRDLKDFPIGSAKYTVMCAPDGGIVDDLIVYRLAGDEVLVCVNAATRAGDVAWLQEHVRGNVEVVDESAAWGQLALQGPKARELAQGWLPAEAFALEAFECTWVDLMGTRVLVARTGYTGEDGYELYVPSEALGEVWDAALGLGEEGDVRPIGLGARDTLRLEARLHLYGSDIHRETNPLEAGLSWTVGWDKTGFVGEERLRAVKESGPSRRLVGLVLPSGGVLRAGYPVLDGDAQVGTLTSGSVAPSLGGVSIGLAYVDARVWKAERLEVEIRGRRLEVEVTRKPFYRRPTAGA